MIDFLSCQQMLSRSSVANYKERVWFSVLLPFNRIFCMFTFYIESCSETVKVCSHPNERTIFFPYVQYMLHPVQSVISILVKNQSRHFFVHCMFLISFSHLYIYIMLRRDQNTSMQNLCKVTPLNKFLLDT